MPAKPLFEELDFRETELGDLILRRRTVLSLEGLDVYEIILGDAFLMSSLFTAVEVALADLGLAAVEKNFAAHAGGEGWQVVVGGLGLGYTARAALKHNEVARLAVVDYLEPVIDWHRRGLVPLGNALTSDPRCRLLHGDFFQLALDRAEEASFDPQCPGEKYHAILLDIDHSPRNLLHRRHRDFYSAAGLRSLCRKLHPGGVFALWSDDPPDEPFMNALREVFADCDSHIVRFDNPLQGGSSESTVYVASLRRQDDGRDKSS